MKFLKYLMLTAAGLASINAFAQQETNFERRMDSRDDTAVREFVGSKESIDVKKKANNLEISGDVRFVWQNKHEKGDILFVEKSSSSSSNKEKESNKESNRKSNKESNRESNKESNRESNKESNRESNKESNKESKKKSEKNSQSDFSSEHRSLRGNGFIGRDGIPISNNDFNVKFNLKVKYDFDKTWAMGHLQFNNLAGISSINDCDGEFPVFNAAGDEIARKVVLNRRFGGKGSGFGSAINLKRAYIGHNLYADGKHRLDMELGRRQLDDIFMSEIQFDNYFDGVLFEYASQISKVSDFYLKAGAFIIDQRVDHYGWATELGFLSIGGSDLDFRYSFIDWSRHGRNRCSIFNPIGSKFQISQFTLAYEIVPKLFGYEIPIEVYGAFLINTAAEKNIFSDNRKANLGWYLDLYAGNVVKKGDWTFEFIYAVVQAQAVPDFDVAGIGRGNIFNERLTDFIPRSLSSHSSDSLSSVDGYLLRQGNANYQGCLFDFLYAITDNFSLDLSYEFSVPVDKHIGGSHKYQNIEIEFLYAF